MNIYLKSNEGFLSLHYESSYASGWNSVRNIDDLIRAIEEVCGKGSYCLYQGKGTEYPDSVPYNDYKKFEGKWPSITYWQQGVKTQVIEQAREEAKKVWGKYS